MGKVLSLEKQLAYSALMFDAAMAGECLPNQAAKVIRWLAVQDVEVRDGLLELALKQAKRRSL